MVCIIGMRRESEGDGEEVNLTAPGRSSEQSVSNNSKATIK